MNTRTIPRDPSRSTNAKRATVNRRRERATKYALSGRTPSTLRAR